MTTAQALARQSAVLASKRTNIAQAREWLRDGKSSDTWIRLAVPHIERGRGMGMADDKIVSEVADWLLLQALDAL